MAGSRWMTEVVLIAWAVAGEVAARRPTGRARAADNGRHHSSHIHRPRNQQARCWHIPTRDLQ
eukprot:1191579-Prorocentrum_minimum.AAC.2